MHFADAKLRFGAERGGHGWIVEAIIAQSPVVERGDGFQRRGFEIIFIPHAMEDAQRGAFIVGEPRGVEGGLEGIAKRDGFRDKRLAGGKSSYDEGSGKRDQVARCAMGDAETRLHGREVYALNRNRRGMRVAMQCNVDTIVERGRWRLRDGVTGAWFVDLARN